jgi:Methyltransferase domain
MGANTESVQLDGDKLMQFVFRAVDEAGATLNAALVVMGDKLGLYRALAGRGGLSPAELAERTGTAERYVREWLNARAAGGFAAYEPDSGRYTLPPEQTIALTGESSPDYLPGFFQIAPAAGYSGSGYDLVTMFDCLHDMGDPVGAARHMRSTLKPDGTWMIVEPNAGDRVEDNLNPVGRAYYGFSTLLCRPASLSQEIGLALGAQAGEARIRDVVATGGFARFRRVAETPFNLVFEVRP